MVSLETTKELHDVISYNDATISGILIAIAIAFGSVIYYLFKTSKEKDIANEQRLEKLHKDYALEITNLYKEHIKEIKLFNDALIKINKEYSDSFRNLNDSIRNLLDFKKK